MQMKPYHIPGLVFTGAVVRHETLGDLPVYEMAPGRPGIPSINTAEGWELRRRENVFKRISRRLRRAPTEEEFEFALYMDKLLCRRFARMYPVPEQAELEVIQVKLEELNAEQTEDAHRADQLWIQAEKAEKELEALSKWNTL